MSALPILIELFVLQTMQWLRGKGGVFIRFRYRGRYTNALWNGIDQDVDMRREFRKITWLGKVVFMPVIPALGRRRWDQRFKVIPGNIVNWNPAWAT